MNVLDRVVGFFNPLAGLNRAKARAQTAIVMNYDAASRGRRTYGWKAPATSADAAAYGSRARLRQISRDMVRNRAYAARARDVVVANVVGDGIMPSIRCENEAHKTKVEQLVRQHLLSNDIDALGEYDLLEMQQICMSGVFTDGEVFIRRRPRDARFGARLALPYQVEVLEPDLLDTTIQNNGKNLVVEGVEYGPTGAIEAYHFLSEHPGAVQHRRAPQSTRIHWSDVIHIRRFDRPGQLRGVPWLAPVMMTIGELSDYQEAQILKQRMSALLAVMLKWASGSNRPADEQTGLESLEPGAVVSLPDGAEPVPTDPPKVDGYADFMKQGLRAVAAGVGVTYEALAVDLEKVNFSSARLGRNEMDRLVRMWQRGLMIAQFGTGMERWFREGMALMGHRGIEFTMDWTPPRRILVDPTREIPAMVEEIDAGLNSRQGVQRELGRDPARIREERAQDMQADSDAGLPELSGGAAVSASGEARAAEDQRKEKQDDDGQ